MTTNMTELAHQYATERTRAGAIERREDRRGNAAVDHLEGYTAARANRYQSRNEYEYAILAMSHCELHGLTYADAAEAVAIYSRSGRRLV